MKSVKFFNLLLIIILGLFSCSNEGKPEIVYEKVYVDKVYAEPVTFSVAETDVEGELSVMMSSKTEGAEIYYTTDINIPSKRSKKYKDKIIVKEDTFFYAITMKEGLENSPVSYASISIREKKVIKTEYVTETEYVTNTEFVDKVYVSPVIFSIEETQTEGELSVIMLSKTDGAEIFYTTDNSIPTQESTKYIDAVTVTEDTIFTAIAIKENMENSPVSYSVVSIKEKKIIETKIETVEVVKNDKDTTIPSGVTNLTAFSKDSCVLLTWTDAVDEDIFGYEVSYSGSAAINRAVISPIAKTSMMVPQGSGGCYVNGLTNGTEYTFTVKTVDTSENKSDGVTVKATPFAPVAGETLSIVLTAAVPQENGYTGDKSNTTVTVTANITTASTVKKVVWKKNGSLVAKTLLADTGATTATADTDDNAKWTFEIEATDETANGTYTVAAIDESGREEAEQITIDQFDFTPPQIISELNAVYSVENENDIVILNWNNPSVSDFDHVEISYTYNDGSVDSDESEAEIVSLNNKSFNVKVGTESSAKIYKYYVKSVDKLGNKSLAATRSVSVDPNTNAGYQFHEGPEYLPVGTTNGTLGTSGTYVYFGDWPQTIKADDVTVDETQSMTMGGFTYYKGSDDNWYAKCTENAYENNYTYSDGTTVAQSSASSIKYFKVEPIKWRVLNPDENGTEKKILLAESILTANVPYYGSTNDRTLDETTIYANNYKYSNIRAWLNGINNQFVMDGGTSNSYMLDWTNKGFLYGAFTTSAQSLIAQTTVDNSERSTNTDGDSNATSTYRANQYASDSPTSDKIFLLSVQEVTKSDYGFADYSNSSANNARIRVTTDYAKANYAYYTNQSTTGGYWWLRSPYWYTYRQARCISQDGSNDYYTLYNAGRGVVPALCLN